jgi:hypothetical protein
MEKTPLMIAWDAIIVAMMVKTRNGRYMTGACPLIMPKRRFLVSGCCSRYAPYPR